MVASASLFSGIRIAAVAFVMAAGSAAFAGTTSDQRPANESVVPVLLDLAPQSPQTTVPARVIVQVETMPPAVAAPLPPAVAPGLALLSGTWLYTRVLKRKLV